MSGKFRFTGLAISTVTIGVLTVSAVADELVLADGSRLVGQVQTMADGKVVISTDFAGDMTLEMDRVRGITTDKPMSIQLDRGNSVEGALRYSADGQQQVVAASLGAPLNVELGRLSAIWAAGQDRPDLGAPTQEDQNPWTVKLQLGVDGQSGNTDRFSINGQADFLRTLDAERLLLYAKVRTSHENGDDTTKEFIAGISLEHDIDDRWFGFGKIEYERDKFENLNYRITATTGLGYFVIKEAEEEWKWRGGVGFQIEDFAPGDDSEDAIAELGWDYRKEISPHMLFTHSLVLYPTLDAIKDIRIVMDNAAEIPLASDEAWKLRMGVRNDYNGQPEGDVERLDTFYYLNVVWDWQ